jgi:hypothetical protein
MLIKKIFSIFLLSLILVIVVSCNKAEKLIGDYEVVDSIKINYDDIINIYSLKKIKNNFVFFNLLDHNTIFLIDNNGNVLSKYFKKGKGPGEILRIQRLSVYENKIYVIDADNRKLLIFDIIDNQIKYNREFKIKNQSMIPLVINDNRILISNLGKNNLALYDEKGNLLKTFSIDSKKNIRNLEDFIATGLSLEKFSHSNRISLAGFVTGKLSYYDFDVLTDSLSFVKDIHIRDKVIGHTKITKDNKNEKTVNIKGLRSHQCLRNKCIISINNPSIEHSLEVFDEKGNYMGLIKIIHLNGKDNISNPILSNNEKILWFTKNDNDLIYIAKKI